MTPHWIELGGLGPTKGAADPRQRRRLPDPLTGGRFGSNHIDDSVRQN